MQGQKVTKVFPYGYPVCYNNNGGQEESAGRGSGADRQAGMGPKGRIMKMTIADGYTVRALAEMLVALPSHMQDKPVFVIPDELNGVQHVDSVEVADPPVEDLDPDGGDQFVVLGWPAVGEQARTGEDLMVILQETGSEVVIQTSDGSYMDVGLIRIAEDGTVVIMPVFALTTETDQALCTAYNPEDKPENYEQA